MHNRFHKLTPLGRALLVGTRRLPVETLPGLTYFILFVWFDRHPDHRASIPFPGAYFLPPPSADILHATHPQATA